MITHLIIENFKAIEKLEVPLRPFTILVGPNDSGKSTILQALEIASNQPIYEQSHTFRLLTSPQCSASIRLSDHLW